MSRRIPAREQCLLFGHPDLQPAQADSVLRCRWKLVDCGRGVEFEQEPLEVLGWFELVLSMNKLEGEDLFIIHSPYPQCSPLAPIGRVNCHMCSGGNYFIGKNIVVVGIRRLPIAIEAKRAAQVQLFLRKPRDQFPERDSAWYVAIGLGFHGSLFPDDVSRQGQKKR